MAQYICKLKLNYMELVKDDTIKKIILVLVLLFGVSLVLGATSNGEPDFYDDPYAPNSYDDPYSSGSYNDPHTPNYDDPYTPGFYDDPYAPGYYDPHTPNHDDPYAPGYYDPHTPNYDDPYTPGFYDDPYTPGFYDNNYDAVDGVCGVDVDTCKNGTYKSLLDNSTHYLWNCIGLNGGSDASCSKPKSSTDGVCDNSGRNRCSSGSSNDGAHADTTCEHRWRCDGVRGGSNSGMCSIVKPSRIVNGVCDNSGRNRCSSGDDNDEAVTDTTTHYRWRCGGSCGGSNSGTCSYPIPPSSIDGVCGSSVNSCIDGTLSDIGDNSTHYLWNCIGLNGGSDASCSKPKSSTDGVCDNSGRNRCSSGSSNDGAHADTTCEHRWRCDGVRGGSNSGMCSIVKPSRIVNGVCDNSGRNRCSSGDDNDEAVTDTTTHYRWRCGGSCGGSNSGTCSYPIPPSSIDGVCGSSVNSCIDGTLSDIGDNSTHYLWNCIGLNGGSNASCNERISLNEDDNTSNRNNSNNNSEKIKLNIIFGSYYDKLYRPSQEHIQLEFSQRNLFMNCNEFEIDITLNNEFNYKYDFQKRVIPVHLGIGLFDITLDELRNESDTVKYNAVLSGKCENNPNKRTTLLSQEGTFQIPPFDVTYDRLTNKIRIKLPGYTHLENYDIYMFNITLHNKFSLTSIFEQLSNRKESFIEFSVEPSLLDKLREEPDLVKYNAILYGGKTVGGDENHLNFSKILGSQEGLFLIQFLTLYGEQYGEEGCGGYCDIGPFLWMGDGDHSKYDLFFVFEGKTVEEVEDQLDRHFRNGDYSLFKTNPFIEQEDKFNIYYAIISDAYDYKLNKECKWGTYPRPDSHFNNIFAQYDWIDGEVHFSQNPSVWPYAKYGKYIQMSYACYRSVWGVNWDKTFVHEFGHLFGSLRDEYIYPSLSDNNARSHDRKNCLYIRELVGKKCENGCELKGTHRWEHIPNFDGEVLSGCKHPLLFRGEFNSIMRNELQFYKDTWAGGWGPVNEYYLREKLEENYS